MESIYLDHAASAPLRPEAFQAMVPYLKDAVGNPNAAHAQGRKQRSALEEARERIAACVGARPEEIFFTSGGTESDAWAVHMGLWQARRRAGCLAASPIEHHAVLRPLENAARQGALVRYLSVSPDGAADPDRAAGALTGAAFVSLMAANNETGVIQPLEIIAVMAKERGALFHTDAVQAAGCLRIDLESVPVDYMSASAHKFGGPVGVGFLYIRRGSPRCPLIRGGAQESNLRAGTQDVAGAVGMAAALEAASKEEDRLSALRAKLEDALRGFPGAVIHGRERERLPGIINVCLPGVPSAVLLPRLDLRGVCASAGAACTAGAAEVSHVLLSMGVSREDALCSMRFSLGWTTTPEEIEKAGRIILEEAAAVRERAVR